MAWWRGKASGLLLVALVLHCIETAVATCPQGPDGAVCSGHGTCSTDGTCTCGRRWSGSSCGQERSRTVTPPPSVTRTTTATVTLEVPFFNMIIESSQFAVLASPGVATRASLLDAVGNDLTALYQALAQVIQTDVTVHRNATAIPFFVGDQDAEIPAAVTRDLNGNATWMTRTWAVFSSAGGTQPLVVSSYVEVRAPLPTPLPPVPSPVPSPVPPGLTPSPGGGGGAPSPSPTLSKATVIAIGVGSFAALSLIVILTGSILWRWRHNPYAAARAPLDPAASVAASFPLDDFAVLHRPLLRAVNYQEAKALPAAPSVAAGPSGSGWVLAASVKVPTTSKRRVEFRLAWDDMAFRLFPTVFTTLTNLRVTLDGRGGLWCAPRDVAAVLAYSGAFRLRASGDNPTSIELVLTGHTGRMVIQSIATDALLGAAVPTFKANAGDTFNDAKSAIGRSGLVSFIGSDDPSKVIFAKVRSYPSFILPDASLEVLPTVLLSGVPTSWSCDFVDAVLRIMLRVASSSLLEDTTDWCREMLHLRRSDALSSSSSRSGCGSWSITGPASVLNILRCVASRFWVATDDVIGYQHSVGILFDAVQHVQPAAASVVVVEEKTPMKNTADSGTTSSPGAPDNIALNDEQLDDDDDVEMQQASLMETATLLG